MSFLSLVYNCCRKTAVCNGDQLLDFSVPELVRSQSTFSTDPKVLQNCAGFTMCSSAGLAVGECSVMGLTPCMHVVSTDLLCVACIGLLSAEFSPVNTGLGRTYVLETSVPVEYSSESGCHKLSTYINYLNFQPKNSTFSKKLTQKYQKLEVISSFISSKPRQHSIAFHNVLV